VLADSLRTDLKLFRRIELGDPVLVELRAMTRAHEELTADALMLANRLREQLRRYFPQMLGLGNLHDEPWPGVAEAASQHAALLLPRLRVVHAQQRLCMQRIQALMAHLCAPPAVDPDAAADDGAGMQGHRDATLLLSLPGLGVLTSATMLTEATNPLRQRDYQSLRAQCGVAPVSSKTGKQRQPSVKMRRACNPRLRNATYHWARVSMQRDAHSREHYGRLPRCPRPAPRRPPDELSCAGPLPGVDEG
jgi:transposase